MRAAVVAAAWLVTSPQPLTTTGTHSHTWGPWGAAYVNEQICGSGESPPTKKRTCKDRTCACGEVESECGSWSSCNRSHR